MHRIPYGQQDVGDDDVEAVSDTLRSAWLTTGPQVEAFEAEVAAYVGARFGVAVNSGTAALHCAMHALGVGPGDEVIVPTLTFAASANCVLYEGATPVFCDVRPDDLLIDVDDVERRITPRTKAILAVDYAGQPCDYGRLRALASAHGVALLADGCHALGAKLDGRGVGAIADMTAFSFHPVKHITTGEGGMVTTDDAELHARMRRFRNHGIDTDARQREQQATFRYDVVELGFNYRLPDAACALGRSQLHKLPKWIAARQRLAQRYDDALRDVEGVRALAVRAGVEHAYHLYVVRIDPTRTRGRDAVFASLRAAGVHANVHYIPVHLHPLYRKRLGTREGTLPNAESGANEILSLPMFPGLSDADFGRVVDALVAAL